MIETYFKLSRYPSTFINRYYDYLLTNDNQYRAIENIIAHDMGILKQKDL